MAAPVGSVTEPQIPPYTRPVWARAPRAAINAKERKRYREKTTIPERRNIKRLFCENGYRLGAKAHALRVGQSLAPGRQSRKSDSERIERRAAGWFGLWRFAAGIRGVRSLNRIHSHSIDESYCSNV